MKIEINKPKKEDSLSEVVSGKYKKKSIVLILMGLIVLIFFSFYFNHKQGKKSVQPIEETYTVPAETSLIKPPQPVVEKPVLLPVSPASQITKEMMEQQILFVQEKQKELQQRLAAPLMLVNSGQANTTAIAPLPNQLLSRDANTDFMNQVSAQNMTPTMAIPIGPLNYMIAEGNFIHAILESASNSDLPGNLRAIVSQPVYSEDGTQILVSRGSRLVGQYKSGMMQGQSRIFIVWTRLITTEGFSINLGSPGVDSLGVAGKDADEIDRHFWQRFGTASLLSLIGAGAANVGINSEDPNNSALTYRTAVATSFSQSAGQSLQQESMIAPTLKTYQGKPIMVFVARDLNFQQVIQKIKPKIDVF